jgi:uncharacterized protein (DUF362 family)
LVPVKDQVRKVFILVDENLDYPKNPPFNPPEEYPESPIESGLDEHNTVYSTVRSMFFLMNLDAKNFGTSKWSPLSEFTHKGETVLIKPNLVIDTNLSGDSIFAVITHASLVRVMIDYAYKAIGDSGKIIIADAPQHDADFKKIIEITGLKETIEYLKDNFSIPIELYDLRKEYVVYKDGVIVKRITLSGDPKGYVKVDLKKCSMLAEIDSEYKKFYGADYNRKETMKYHNREHHTYIISRTFLESDLVINLPKLKTHMKSGITVSLKNMLGIVGEKNCIVHYRIGSPQEGGDEFPKQTMFSDLLIKLNRIYSDMLLSKNLGINLYRLLIKLIGGKSKFGSESGELTHSGNWHGNDTIWRTIVDINKIALYADKNGEIHETPQRKMLILVDGIIGGEGQGPLAPKAKKCGVIILGMDPRSVDLVATRLMGFNEYKIPLFSKAINLSNYIDSIETKLIENGFAKTLRFEEIPNLHFIPPKSWWLILNKE